MCKEVYLILIGFLYVARGEVKYRLTYDRLDTIFKNEALLDFFGYTGYYNRTVKAVNIQVTFLKHLPENTMISFLYYTFQSNTYRLTAVQIAQRLSEILEMKNFDMDGLIGSFKPPFKWPLIPQVIYKLENFTQDCSKFPPLLPDGKFKYAIKFTLGEKQELLHFDVYGNLQRIYM